MIGDKRHRFFRAVESLVDDGFLTGGNVIASFLIRFAPYLVIFAPAVFMAHTVAKALIDQMGFTQEFAYIVGAIAAASLESVGLFASKLAVTLYTRNNPIWRLAATGTVAYLVVGIGTLWVLDNLGADPQAVGTAMFLMAGIVYILQGVAAGVGEAAADRADATLRAEAREAREREERLELDAREREERLAERQAKREFELERLRIAQVGRSGERSGEQAKRQGVRTNGQAVLSDVRAEQVAQISGEFTGGSFGTRDVQDLLDVSRTTAYNVLTDAQDAGQIVQVGRGKYQVNGTH